MPLQLFKLKSQLVHSCHSVSRRAVSDAGVYLPSLSRDSSFAVNPILVVSEMPGAPTRSTADNMTAARQKVGPPSTLGANPDSYFLGDHPKENRMDMFNGFINLYMNGQFFRQRDVAQDFWAEDPTALTELLVSDSQWYEQHFRSTSKMLTSLLRHNNSLEFQRIRRNRTQGDVALIDFLLTGVMQRNFPKLCPASLWALAHCMNKQRFTFGTAIGTDNLRCRPDLKLRFDEYLRVEKRVNPEEYEVVTIASCAGHSFVYTREIPEGESEDIEYLKLGNTSDGKPVWKGGQNVYRVMVVHIHHAVARTACRSCRINFADLLVLCAHFQVDLTGGDFNAFSYRYYKSGSQQIAASLQDSSLAVMLRRFDEGINASRDVNTNHPDYKFKSDIYMAYHDEHIDEYRLVRDSILDEVPDAARESSKIPRLQKALQELDENFDVIGLINFNWDHTVSRPPSHQLSGRRTPEAKSTIIKSKYAVRYLAGQEKMCRLSGMAQNITPELLQLRARDHDMHRVLKVALQPWPTLAGLKALIAFGVNGVVFDSYFRADYFCKRNHDDDEFRHKLRKTAVDRASSERGGTNCSHSSNGQVLL